MGGLFGKKKTPAPVSSPRSPRPLKVAFIGDEGVGKTSIILRLADGTFSEQAGPMPAEYKTFQNANQAYRLHHGFRTVTTSLFLRIHMCIIVIDLTNGESYFDGTSWLAELDKHCPTRPPCFLVANKLDIRHKRIVDLAALRDFSTQHKVEFFEVSAKDNTGMVKLAERIVALCQPGDF